MGLAPYVLTFFLFFYFSFVQDFLSFEKFVKVEHDNMKWGWNYLKVKKFWSTFQISFKLGGTNTMSFLTFHCPMAECCALQFSFGKRIWQFRNCNLSTHSSIKNQYIQKHKADICAIIFSPFQTLCFGCDVGKCNCNFCRILWLYHNLFATYWNILSNWNLALSFETYKSK